MNAKFILEFVKHPVQMSTMIPTSGQAGLLMAELAGAKKAKTIVELGAAHGNVTRQILKLMHPDAKLYAIEINKTLAAELKKINDPRLMAIHGDAMHTDKILNRYGIKKADCIISTLPLTTLPERTVRSIINNSKKKLNGPFVQIQYSRIFEKQLKKHFKKTTYKFVLENMPPAFIYQCWK
ncbi:MAG: NAD-binding protein [Candidatus Woesearchaeota archaeon]